MGLLDKVLSERNTPSDLGLNEVPVGSPAFRRISPRRTPLLPLLCRAWRDRL